MADHPVESLFETIDPHFELRRKTESLVAHPLFSKLRTLQAIQTFMEYHVWCVWDFMCLTKSIQNAVSVDGPWLPSPHPQILFEINRILAEEETDLGPSGSRCSHFEVFLDAMRLAGARSEPIDAFVRGLRAGQEPLEAMSRASAPSGAVEFVEVTLRHARGPLHVRAAAFCIAREKLVPKLLLRLSENAPWHLPGLAGLRWYVDRHVKLDIGYHGPSSQIILEASIGGSADRVSEAMKTALEALDARGQYLDAMMKDV